MRAVSTLLGLVGAIALAFVFFASLVDTNDDVSAISGPQQTLFNTAPTLLVVVIAALLLIAAVGVAFYIFHR